MPAILDQDDLFIPLPDGTRLAARLWRPEGGEPVPAVLEFIPYRKRDNTLARDETIHPWMAAQGYACLRVDLRGSGDSEGVFEDEYSVQELQDACDVIAWISAQDWCSGNVGMMGKSWGAFNCLQTAALNPPALKAVVSVCGTVDRFNDDIHYKGGCLLGENFAWGTLMLSYNSRPADPLLRPDWREDWVQRLEGMPHLSERWSQHQARDAYWKHGSVCEDFGAIKAAVLTLGGWADGYMNAPAHLVRNAAMAKAIVGPWVHQYPHTAVPGPRIGFLHEMKRWWDHWLKGADNGAADLPTYRVFMQDSSPPDACAPEVPGCWLPEELPSPRVQDRSFALGGDGQLGGQGTPDRRIQTPQTLGLNAGEFFPMGLSGEMPGDQSADDALSVCFELPCPDGLALMGAASLQMTLSADRPFGFIVARLCDVAPDGQSRRIAHGILNLHHRSDPPAPLVPGQAETVTLALDQMAYRLAPGHRLRLALSNSYWPFVWPSPETVALHLSGGTLTLPVHAGAAADYAFDPAETPPPPRLLPLSPGHDSRIARRDMINGIEEMETRHTSGRERNPDHGLETESTMRELWRIHPDDPLSAENHIEWTQNFARGDWSVGTKVVASQTVTATHLILRATLTAWEGTESNRREVVRRSFVADVTREHV
ncbi:MAG: CocE/NonD family hydrolase [Pararhodobacter sp.]|nr:CocE/NonD family hydrolase [Pararhodobacter sp.]